MQISRIQLKNINFTDLSFSLLPEACLEQESQSLLESINRVGILAPPIIKEGEQNFAHRIIAGRKRLYTASSLGMHSCACLKVPFDLPLPETLDILWEEAIFSHPLSPLEQAMFFEKISRELPAEDIAGRFLPSLGLSPSAEYVNKKLQLLKLDEPLQTALHQGQLSEQVARRLGGLSFPDRMALFEVIELLKLSVSNQKKLVESCCELAARNRTTVLSILSQPDLAGIINAPEKTSKKDPQDRQLTNVPQKANLYMRSIQEKRYPLLSEAENEFRRFLSELTLPPHISISHDPSFERDKLDLTVSCSSRDEVRNLLDKIRNTP